MQQEVSLEQEVKLIQESYKIIGRERELKLLLIAVKAHKHIILEGMVGTGKTYLAHALAKHSGSKFYRVDGSEDVLSHVLTGFFDPPIVLAKGYHEDAFIFGPLSNAMLEGACLFINELNRIPESTQNILLSSLDEKTLIIPKLKTIEAHDGFITIATQNPTAHVGVSALGEALKDRFLWINIGYQPEMEEIDIVRQNLDEIKHKNLIANIAVKVTRATREHPEIRRGSSIRGALDLAHLAQAYGKKPSNGFWQECAIMSLHSKIELVDGINRNAREIIIEIVATVLENF